jgi:selenocysteine-specific elongation factor
LKKHTIIGTAGHIDHGKTALIRALTGIDADRLKEEKERGITIDIGFAYWRDDVTIIDVPGHEKFIRNMVAGVSTIDFFLLVIAADDGIMPQTIEHLDILQFFNVNDGIVIINKIDLVDSEWLDLVYEEVQELMNRYGLSHLPVFKVSALHSTNIDALKSAIESKISSLEEKHLKQPFRLLVDRSFSIKGFGTVVTGTVLSGLLHKGDEVDQMPQQRRLKVRGIQTHISDITEVSSGYRAAINLQGIEKTDVQRGDVICQPGSMKSCTTFTGLMQTVRELPVRVSNRARVHIYTGTAERTGQLIWFEDQKILTPASSYHVRVTTDHAVTVAPGDAFLVRLHSPVITLAGGSITEIDPPKIRHVPDSWQPYFEMMNTADPTRMINNIIDHSGPAALSVTDIQQKLFMDAGEISAITDQALKKNRLKVFSIKGENRYINSQNFERLSAEIHSFIRKYHEINPIKPGINRQELINGMKKSWVAAEILDAAIQKLINSNAVELRHNLYADRDFKVKVSKETDTVRNEILDILKHRRFAPPFPEEMSGIVQITPAELKTITGMLTAEKRIILIKSLYYLHIDVWHELTAYLREYFLKHPELSIVTLKEFIQTTRKFAIPLLEHLDSEGYTQRKGEFRIKGARLDSEEK